MSVDEKALADGLRKRAADRAVAAAKFEERCEQMIAKMRVNREPPGPAIGVVINDGDYDAAMFLIEDDPEFIVLLEALVTARRRQTIARNGGGFTESTG